jgi:hypothetical protein
MGRGEARSSLTSCSVVDASGATAVSYAHLLFCFHQWPSSAEVGSPHVLKVKTVLLFAANFSILQMPTLAYADVQELMYTL